MPSGSPTPTVTDTVTATSTVTATVAPPGPTDVQLVGSQFDGLLFAGAVAVFLLVVLLFTTWRGGGHA